MSTPSGPKSNLPPEPRDERDLGFDLPEPAKPSRGRVVLVAVVLASVLGGAFVFGALPKRRARLALEAKGSGAVATGLPRVDVVSPKVLKSDQAMVLPGTVRPLEEAILRPRANGYVRSRFVDLGDKVAAGAPLVEIDTPELDQQLAQARAQLAQASAALAQAKASRDLAHTSLTRYEKLTRAGASSQEELDKVQSAAAVADSNIAFAQASLDAQGANVQRLTQEKAFARVTAPFAGTIVSRSVDKGALVSASSELFKLATVDPVRVLVEVPQGAAPSVQADVAAVVTVREFPDRRFEGKVARFAGALNPASRTMTTDVRVPNPKGELLAGMYARVEITLPTPHEVLEIPATALVSGAQGNRVAVVDEGGAVHFKPITIERDTGATLLVTTGLSPSDRVIAIPTADLTDGRAVEINARK